MRSDHLRNKILAAMLPILGVGILMALPLDASAAEQYVAVTVHCCGVNETVRVPAKGMRGLGGEQIGLTDVGCKALFEGATVQYAGWPQEKGGRTVDLRSADTSALRQKILAPQNCSACTEIDSFVRKFKNCREAEQYIDRARTDPTLQVGEADVHLKPTLGRDRVLKQADGTFKAEVAVQWSLDADKTRMTLPNWCFQQMTDAEKAAVKQFLDALKVHEEGHVTVAEDFGKEISGPQSAVSATQEEARTKLQEKLNEYLDESKKELDFRTEFYDNKTDHGAKQSKGPEFGLPGGRDVILNCP